MCVRLCGVGNVEPELLHTYSKVDPLDVLVLCVRLAVLVAVTLTVPVVLFPVRTFITPGQREYICLRELLFKHFSCFNHFRCH